MRTLAALLLAACQGAPSEPSITLEGPTDVRVERLGPVAGPRALAADGSEARAVVWTVSAPEVAAVTDGQIVATGPGTAQIVGSLGTDEVRWTLTVDPLTTLAVKQAPATLAVGATGTVVLEARAGDQPVPLGDVTWSSSDPAVLTVAAGELRGVAPGSAYVTARRGRSEAMIQVDVQP